MLSFMSDRRVLAASAAFITAAILLFLIGTFPSWKTPVGMESSWSHGGAASEPSAVADIPAKVRTDLSGTQGAATPPAAPTRVAEPKADATISAPQQTALADGTGAPDPTPTFDIVRIEPTGESVIAARARAGASIVLLDEGRPIAQAQADASGQVAFLPPALSPGEHSLMLSVGEPNTPGALSSQSVTVSVSEQPKTQPMVALTQPDQPTKILSDAGAAPARTGQGPTAATATPTVSVGAIDVEQMGSVFATGKATPGSHCRVYLNGSFVATVLAGKDGAWSLKIQRGMKAGRYTVRVDQIASADGQVQARSEVPFDYPAAIGNAASLLRPKHAAKADIHTGDTATMKRLAAVVPGGSNNGPMPESPDMAHNSGMDSTSNGGVGSTTAALPLAQSVASASPIVPAPASATTIVAQLLTTKVVHGDSLWRISRKILGHGQRYTQIYAANTTQIRDPRLIYPGQIFVMPQAAP